MIGTPFDDYIVGTSHNETFYGGGGADLIEGGGGNDVAWGGAEGDGCVDVDTVHECESSVRRSSPGTRHGLGRGDGAAVDHRARPLPRRDRTRRRK